MKRLIFFMFFIIVCSMVLVAVGLSGGVVALATTELAVSRSCEGAVSYGVDVVLTAEFSQVESYDSIAYTWLKNDTAGGWDFVAEGASVTLRHVSESGDYKCLAKCYIGGERAKECTSAGVNVKIIPKPVAVNIESRSVIYGDAEPELGYVAESDKVLAGDDLNIVLAREYGTLPGDYRIYGSAYNQDYDVSFTEGVFHIGKRPLDIVYSIVGTAIEDGSETQVKVTINGILDGDNVIYSLFGDKNSSSGRYTAVLDLQGAENYAYSQESLKFDYVIYNGNLQNDELTVEFKNGVLPEAELITSLSDCDNLPVYESLVSCLSVYPSYDGVFFDGGECVVTLLNIDVKDGYEYYAYFGDEMIELKVDVDEYGNLKVYAPHSGKIIISRGKFGRLEIALICTGGVIVLGGVAFAICFAVSKKKKSKSNFGG